MINSRFSALSFISAAVATMAFCSVPNVARGDYVIVPRNSYSNLFLGFDSISGSGAGGTFRYTNFFGSTFSSDFVFTNADLFSASLQRITIPNPDAFVGADLSYAQLSGVGEFSLTNAQLRSAASIVGIIAVNADLTSFDFSDRNLSNAAFDTTNFTNASFANSNLTDIRFQDVNLTNADFTGADLTGANFTRYGTVTTGTVSASQLRSASKVTGVNFTNNNLSAYDLSSLDLTGANLTNTNLAGTNFTGANLANATIATAALQTAEFSGANLSGATLGDAASTDGFVYDNTLNITGTTTLVSAGQARLGSLTKLGTDNADGTLIVTNGAVVASGRSLEGRGTIQSTNAEAQAVAVNGSVLGTGPGLTFTGYVKGTGTFNGPVTFAGTFSPGLGATRLETSGFSLTNSSTLVMELGGTTAGTQYDQIAASGALTFSGTLRITQINGFTASPGDSFQLFSYGASPVGTFSAIQLPALGGGQSWDTSGLYTTGFVTVVPEPSTYALLALGGAGLFWMRRRRAQ